MRHPVTVRTVVALMACVTWLTAAAPARGGLVGPGESVETSSAAYAPPTGELLAERAAVASVPYTVWDPSVSGAVDFTLIATLTSRVYRSAGGALTFAYAIDVNDPDHTDEGATLALRGFTGFSTDVAVDFVWSEFASAGRSADGATLGLSARRGGTPRVTVVTDAIAYLDDGSATFTAAGEVPLVDPEFGGPSYALAGGSVSFPGTLRPAPHDPVAVPLPLAATAGLVGVLVVVGLQLPRGSRI